MKERKDLKILLIQLRKDEATQEEELNAFAKFGKLDSNQITLLNVFETPVLKPEVADQYDAVFVGGSSDEGDALLQKEKPNFVKSICELLKYTRDNDIPTFASCLGFQVSAVAMGGEFIEDKENMEMGTVEIHLTEEGKKDLLLHDSPEFFMAVSGHSKRVKTLPDGFINLARSELCPIHAFKIPNKPFYAFQFHPEVDAPTLCERITRYKERYLDSEEHLNEIISTCKPTPDANKLVEKFIDRIVLQK